MSILYLFLKCVCLKIHILGKPREHIQTAKNNLIFHPDIMYFNLLNQNIPHPGKK